MTAVKGLAFEETYRQSQFYNEDGLQIKFIHLNHLLQAKKPQAGLGTLTRLTSLPKNDPQTIALPGKAFSAEFYFH